MTTNASRMCELLVGLNNITVNAVERDPSGAVTITITSTNPAPACTNCGQRLRLKDYNPVPHVEANPRSSVFVFAILVIVGLLSWSAYTRYHFRRYAVEIAAGGTEPTNILFSEEPAPVEQMVHKIVGYIESPPSEAKVLNIGSLNYSYGDNVGGDKFGGDKFGGDKVGGDKVRGDKVGGDQISISGNDNVGKYAP